MAGLILKLRPKEQLLINGVVVENGDRRAMLRVRTEGANILRLRDAMRPEDATTPEKRAYYAAQLAISGELTPAQAQVLIDQALAAFRTGAHGAFRQVIMAHAEAGEFYKAMCHIRDTALPARGNAPAAAARAASA